jgi:hypothetical protein
MIDAALDVLLLNITEIRFQDKNRRLTNSENASYYSVQKLLELSYFINLKYQDGREATLYICEV